MTRLASHRAQFIPMAALTGLPLAPLSGASDPAARRYSRLPALRTVRFGLETEALPADTSAGPVAVEPGGQTTPLPVASATLHAAYRGTNYRVVAWQPLGKSAFVFLMAVGERRFLQPCIADGADFDEVMHNATIFVERLLDEDPS